MCEFLQDVSQLSCLEHSLTQALTELSHLSAFNATISSRAVSVPSSRPSSQLHTPRVGDCRPRSIQHEVGKAVALGGVVPDSTPKKRPPRVRAGSFASSAVGQAQDAMSCSLGHDDATISRASAAGRSMAQRTGRVRSQSRDFLKENMLDDGVDAGMSFGDASTLAGTSRSTLSGLTLPATSDGASSPQNGSARGGRGVWSQSNSGRSSPRSQRSGQYQPFEQHRSPIGTRSAGGRGSVELDRNEDHLDALLRHSSTSSDALTSSSQRWQHGSQGVESNRPHAHTEGSLLPNPRPDCLLASNRQRHMDVLDVAMLRPCESNSQSSRCSPRLSSTPVGRRSTALQGIGRTALCRTPTGSRTPIGEVRPIRLEDTLRSALPCKP